MHMHAYRERQLLEMVVLGPSIHSATLGLDSLLPPSHRRISLFVYIS